MKKSIGSIAIIAAAVLAVLIYPTMTYYKGTSRDVSVVVVEEPSTPGGTLVYHWMGDVYRSCDVTIQRSFVDSRNVVTMLTSLNFEAIPMSMRGKLGYEVTIQVPYQLAKGEVKYKAVEVPKCSWLQRLFPIAIPYPPVVFEVKYD